LIFVDANVPMYILGTDHPHKLDAQLLLGRLAREQRRLVTSSEVFQEMLHRYISIGRRDKIEFAFEFLRELVEDVISIDNADVFAAKDLTYSHSGLSARDALHVAVMRRREIAEIVSFDRGFDAVAGIRRLPATPSS
jgi:predicted nucleic acid-binding protein